MAPIPTNVWEELRKLGTRLHAQANDNTRLQGELDELCLRVERLEGSMRDVPTRTDLRHVEELITQKLTMIKESVEPLRKGVYALVWLIVGSVVAAGLAFLITKPGP